MWRTCPECQTEFEVSSERDIKKYCHANCRMAASKRRQTYKMAWNKKEEERRMDPIIPERSEVMSEIEEAAPVQEEVQMQETTEAKPRRNRQRVPLGGPRRKLSHPDIPGYQLRWVNDTGGRLDEFREAGYEYVPTDDLPVGDGDVSNRGGVDSRRRVRVGVHEDGSPMYAYLMKQRQEWYEEDQKAKAENLDEVEKSLFRAYEAPDETNDRRYTPATKPKITRQTK